MTCWFRCVCVYIFRAVPWLQLGFTMLLTPALIWMIRWWQLFHIVSLLLSLNLISRSWLEPFSKIAAKCRLSVYRADFRTMRPDLRFTPSLPRSLFSPWMIAVVYLERSPPAVVYSGGGRVTESIHFESWIRCGGQGLGEYSWSSLLKSTPLV